MSWVYFYLVYLPFTLIGQAQGLASTGSRALLDSWDKGETVTCQKAGIYFKGPCGVLAINLQQCLSAGGCKLAEHMMVLHISQASWLCYCLTLRDMT